MATWLTTDPIGMSNFGQTSPTNVSSMCFSTGNINSNGAWNPSTNNNTENYLQYYSIPNLTLQTSLAFLVTQAVHLLLKPLRATSIVSQIIGGIILGPSCMGHLFKDNFIKTVFPIQNMPQLYTLATFGIIYSQFVIGVKMDPSIVKASGRRAIIAGVSSLIIPLIFCSFGDIIFRYFGELNPITSHELSFLAAAQSMTAFPVVASLLSELKILNSEVGRLALSMAMVSDLFNTFLTLGATNIKIGRGGASKTFAAIIATVALVIVIVFIIRPLCFWVIKKTPEGEPVKEKYIILILIAVLCGAFGSIYIGQNILFGPFILGLAIPDGPPLGSALVDRLDSFATGLLMPLYLIAIGQNVDMFEVNIDRNYGTWQAFLLLFFISLVGKLFGTMLPCLYCKMPISDAITMGIIMNAKGIIEVATYHIWTDSKVIDEKYFTFMIISVVVISWIVSALVSVLYDPSRKYAGYRKRTILHSKPNTELRILACVNEQEDVPTIVKLLETSNPTKESPINVHVVHLIELVGRASPLLICHQMQQWASSKVTRSEPIINAFRYYQQENRDVVTVQAFTAIAPAETLHDDICQLALDKGTSLIIVPFHRRWTVDGTMGSTKFALKSVNHNVVSRAPCSVAVLIDRWNSGGSTTIPTSLRVAMIFLGGADDREALAYADRMAQCASTNLTIVRLIPSNIGGDEDEKLLDERVLKIFRLNTLHNQHVKVIEEVVSDGEQTTKVILSLEKKYDLMMVGRRHRMDSPLMSGLGEWNEYPELGVIGDILASSDIQSGVSVLVMQQQAMLR